LRCYLIWKKPNSTKVFQKHDKIPVLRGFFMSDTKQYALQHLHSDEYWMNQALALAQLAAERGEVPVGALVVLEGQVIGKGFNRPISSNDPTAHAEMIALREAADTVQNYRLVEADLYVTLEPCSMCAGAIVHSRVRRVIYAATEPKAGALDSRQQFFTQPWLNHVVQWQGGVLADEASAMLSGFFKARRAQKKAEKAALNAQNRED
jgi:tRNA(adenine34) deaminase